jgi:hypothetical protein
MEPGKMIPKFRSGQSLIEYTMLIIIVAAALMAMTVYIQRAMYAKLG